MFYSNESIKTITILLAILPFMVVTDTLLFIIFHQFHQIRQTTKGLVIGGSIALAFLVLIEVVF